MPIYKISFEKKKEMLKSMQGDSELSEKLLEGRRKQEVKVLMAHLIYDLSISFAKLIAQEWKEAESASRQNSCDHSKRINNQ